MLTKAEILHQIILKRIEIEPFLPENLQPNSIDVRLGSTLLRVCDRVLDFKTRYETNEIVIPDEGYVLQPDQLYLGVTMERTNTPFHVPVYEGRSTTGRYFLMSHQTAGFGDVGFNGHWTLEITVRRPTRVYAGMRIGQIGFSEAVGHVEHYSGNYAGSCRPVTGKPNNI